MSYCKSLASSRSIFWLKYKTKCQLLQATGKLTFQTLGRQRHHEEILHVSMRKVSISSRPSARQDTIHATWTALIVPPFGGSIGTWCTRHVCMDIVTTQVAVRTRWFHAGCYVGHTSDWPRGHYVWRLRRPATPAMRRPATVRHQDLGTMRL